MSARWVWKHTGSSTACMFVKVQRTGVLYCSQTHTHGQSTRTAARPLRLGTFTPGTYCMVRTLSSLVHRMTSLTVSLLVFVRTSVLCSAERCLCSAGRTPSLFPQPYVSRTYRNRIHAVRWFGLVDLEQL